MAGGVAQSVFYDANIVDAALSALLYDLDHQAA
jgi:hypothetical protein